MSWKPLLWIAHQLLWFVPAFVLFGGAANRRPARDLGTGRIEFAPRPIAFGAWLLLVVYFAHSTVEFVKHSHGKYFDYVNAAGAAFITIVFLCSFPGTVVVTGDSVQQVYWFRRNKCIPWGEIEEINTGEKSRTVTITGAGSTKIVHLRQLADRPRLLLELKRRCAVNLPDFPREPLPKECQTQALI